MRKGSSRFVGGILSILLICIASVASVKVQNHAQQMLTRVRAANDNGRPDLALDALIQEF